MPATSFLCPGCRSTLKSAKPVPDGKKIKCPKCATVFVTPGAAPKPVSAIQEKPSFRPPSKQEPEDEGWEIVEDDEPTTAGQAAKVVEPFKMEDLPMAKPPDLFEDEEEDGARSKGKKVTKKPARDRKQEDKEEELDEGEPQPIARRKQPVPKRTRDDHEDEEEDEDLDEEPAVKRRQPARKPARGDYDDEEDDPDFEDDEDDRDFEDDEDDRPRRVSKRSHKKGGASSAALLLLLIFGGVFLLLAAGGGIGAYLFVNRHRNHGPDDEPLAYVPADCTFLMGVDFGTLAEASPTIAGQLEQALRQRINISFLADCKKNTGVEFRELIDTMLVAAPNQQNGPVMRAASETMILKSKLPFNQNKIRDAARSATPFTHNGKTYFKINEAGASMMFMPSDRILVFSNLSEPGMQALTNLDGKTPALPAETVSMAHNAQKSGNAWMVVAFDANLKRLLQLAATTAPPEYKSITSDLANAKGLELGVAANGSSVNGHLRCTCADNASAERVMKGGESLWNKNVKGLGGVQIAAALAMLPETVRAALKEAINTARFSSQGNVAELSAQIGMKAMEALLKEAGKRAGGNFNFGEP
jgi:hypothetical protein